MREGFWRCKICGYPMGTVEYESTNGFCKECGENKPNDLLRRPKK